MAALASAIEPLRASNDISGQDVFRWQILGETPRPIMSNSNVRFENDGTPTTMEQADILFVLGGAFSKFAHPEATGAALRKISTHTVTTLASVTGGIFALASLGLLNKRKASVHYYYKAAFLERFPEIEVNDRVLTLDQRRLTIAGTATAFEFMLTVIEDVCGAEHMTEVACWFQHPIVRSEESPQKIPAAAGAATTDHLSRQLKEAIDLFESHIEDPLKIADVANLVGLSARQLERSFNAAFAMGPLAYYRQVRLDAARQKVLFTDDPIGQIALSTGFGNAARFNRHYAQAFGHRALDDRKRQLRPFSGARSTDRIVE